MMSLRAVLARRRRNGDRGAAAVEFAIIAPVLFLMVMGIVELALLMRDHVALTSLVRTGGRTASANVIAGPAGLSEGGDCVAPCSPSNAPMLAQLAANAIQRAGSALPAGSINELWIYKANASGYPGAATNKSWICSTECVKYKWVDSKKQFRYSTGTWLSSSINACANNNPDAVGVYMKATHSFLSGIFGSSVTLEDHSVFVVEPMSTLTCAKNQHP
jgi:hypothetical protein